MTKIIEENKLLGEEQFGFRKKRSTIDAVFTLSTVFQKAKAKRWQYACAFIDFSKVDKYDHQHINPRLIYSIIGIWFSQQANAIW